MWIIQNYKFYYGILLFGKIFELTCLIIYFVIFSGYYEVPLLVMSDANWTKVIFHNLQKVWIRLTRPTTTSFLEFFMYYMMWKLNEKLRLELRNNLKKRLDISWIGLSLWLKYFHLQLFKNYKLNIFILGRMCLKRKCIVFHMNSFF